ncbi:MAG: segregation/condensation protein A [Dolichospermum sp.]
MDAVELLETITHLISQAEKGEIDPWDVRVIEVIDHYLKLMSPEATTRGYESDLSQSGQAFLSASKLVLFKANTLMQLSTVYNTPEEVIDDTILEIEDGLLSPARPLQLEQHLRRRPAAMPPRKRRVTLQELIDQLQIMASQLKLVEKSDKPQRTKRQSRVQTMGEALELAHQENLTEVALELEQVLHSAAKERNLEEQCWNLEELIDLWIQTKQPGKNGHNHQSGHGSMISVFWALLLLSAQSKVELFQKEFYQEILVRLPT